MANKLADDLIKTNTEYEKLRGDKARHEPVRETPDHQGPGYRGLERPDFSSWTTEEVRRFASNLEISDAARMSREELLDALEQRQAR